MIMQGIKARYALRQASSARAAEHAQKTIPFALGAWGASEEGSGSRATEKQTIVHCTG